MPSVDTSNPAYRHGHASSEKFSPTYQSWACMIQRVTNPRRPRAEFYNSLGVQPEWLEFTEFLADMGERPPGTSLDRIDNALGYVRGNCRWATQSEQANNTRANVRVTISGRTLSLTQWCRELGISHNTVRARMHKHGYSPEKAITAPRQDRAAAARAMTTKRLSGKG